MQAQHAHAHERHTTVNLVQEMTKMTYNLQQAILSASTVPILVQLQMLPEALHKAAVHAAFPSIAATSSLTVSSRCAAVPVCDMLQLDPEN